MATTTRLMAVEEFRKLREDGGPVYHELRHGEAVAVTRPKARHYVIQVRLHDLLRERTPAGGFVGTELGFRPTPEYELRVADVAYVSNERWQGLDPDDNLRGAPELVIEVLSPSNTAAGIYEKEQICLENGAREFWVVDPDRRQVKVSTPDGHTVSWHAGQEIPLTLWGDVRVSVDAIFG